MAFDPVMLFRVSGSAMTSLTNLWTARQARKLSRELQEKRERAEKELSRLNHEQSAKFQRELFERQKELQLELAAINRETQLQVAMEQRQTLFESKEVDKLFENWPLRVTPRQILESSEDGDRIPLTIILSPPRLQFDRFEAATQNLPDIEPGLAGPLTDFINLHYSPHHRERPARFLGGALESKAYSREASLVAMFPLLRSRPMLILDSEIHGDMLHFRLGGWGLGRAEYWYESIAAVPYWDMVYDAARARLSKARRWRDEQIRGGKTRDEVAGLLGDLDLDLKMLESEESLRPGREDGLQLLKQRYKLQSDDFAQVHKGVAQLHCLVVAGMTDLHHLINYDAPPALPEMTEALLKDAPRQLRPVMEDIAGRFLSSYQRIYEAMMSDRGLLAPEIGLEMARAAAFLPDKSRARKSLTRSLKDWLQIRQLPAPARGDVLQAVLSAAGIADLDYVARLRSCFEALGDQDRVSQLDAFLDDWSKRKVLGTVGQDKKGDTLYK